MKWNEYKFNKLYDYPRSMRTLVGGKRHYDIREEKLAECDNYPCLPVRVPRRKQALEAWRQLN